MFNVILHKSTSTHAPLVCVICIVLIISGIDLFEANAIQFATDLLLDFYSNHVGLFVQWCFWVMHIEHPVVFGVLLVSLLVVSSFLTIHVSTKEEHLIIGTKINLLNLFWLICLLLAVYSIHQEEKHVC